MTLNLSAPSSPVNAGFLSFSPDSSAPTTPNKRRQESKSVSNTSSPDKENSTHSSPNASTPGSPSPAKVAKSKFFQSPAKRTERSVASASSDSPTSPTTGSAEKKFGAISLLSPPAPAPAAAASSSKKMRTACNLTGAFEHEAGLFTMDEKANEEIPKLRAYQRSLTTLLTIKQIVKVRFSQDSINNQTSTGESLESLQANLHSRGWDSGKARLNIVEMPDGKFTSLDNRRLYCVRKVLKKNPDFELPVTIYRFSDIEESNTYYSGIQRDLANNPRKAGLEQMSSQQNLVANTWGYCVYMRMRVLSQQLPSEAAFGYTKLPTVRN